MYLGVCFQTFSLLTWRSTRNEVSVVGLNVWRYSLGLGPPISPPPKKESKTCLIGTWIKRKLFSQENFGGHKNVNIISKELKTFVLKTGFKNQ